MKIVDLDESKKETYFLCLEDWSDELRDAGDHKATWYEEMSRKGLRVKLALDDNGAVSGMIQYIPIENSHIQGSGLFFIYCIWVHGYKEGVGKKQKQGFGKALLSAAEEDARSLGAKGIAAWGISMPFWMKASWFKKQGYRAADKDGMAVLLWKPFTDDAAPPKWLKQKKMPQSTPGKVTVTSFKNGWCPAQNLCYERAKRASSEFGDRVIFNEVDTLNRENHSEWGIHDGLFIDDKQVRTGPPPSYEKIRKRIEKRVKALE